MKRVGSRFPISDHFCCAKLIIYWVLTSWDFMLINLHYFIIQPSASNPLKMLLMMRNLKNDCYKWTLRSLNSKNRNHEPLVNLYLSVRDYPGIIVYTFIRIYSYSNLMGGDIKKWSYTFLMIYMYSKSLMARHRRQNNKNKWWCKCIAIRYAFCLR